MALQDGTRFSRQYSLVAALKVTRAAFRQESFGLSFLVLK
jgi:hypothetical protein